MTIKWEAKKAKACQGWEKGPYNGGTPAPEQLTRLKRRVGGDLILKSKSLYRKKLVGTELFLCLPKKGTT